MKQIFFSLGIRQPQRGMGRPRRNPSLRMLLLRPSHTINISGGVRTAKGLYLNTNDVSVHSIESKKSD